MSAHRTGGGHRARTLAIFLGVATSFVPAQARAQSPASAVGAVHAISLDDAIRLAARESEALQIARAGVTRASGQLRQARSGYLPQLNSQLAYGRTLRSQFSALAGGNSDSTSSTRRPQSVCAPTIPANATPAERAALLAQASTCPPVQGIDFSKVGFGAKNQYTLGLAFSQNLFTGGRIGGQSSAAEASRTAAEIEVTAQRAQLALDVTQAYFDAVLGDRLSAIADTTLAQTEELLRQTQLGRRVGNQSELELLRATVTRDNVRPSVIARRGDRDVAYLRLKQLLNLPLDEPLTLVTPLDEPAAVTQLITANAAIEAGATAQSADTSTGGRAPVRESEAAVRAQEGLLTVARADRLPSLAITSNYQRLFYPSSLFPSLNSYSQNWTIGGSIGWSLFSGGRVGGQIESAQANVDEARARLQQTRELAALDTRVALNQLHAAEASFTASRGTAQQARRAYSIDQLRYKEGLSTQTDLTQSRLLVEQATANQALSARDFAVARARVALIRDLPLNAAAFGARATAQQQPPQQQQQRAPSSMAGAGQPGSTQQ
ncbi:MAG: TolC family protein [Gemmatimonadaceae bacterium]|nr:TolC family protein [Gemmatimonadaceae bacterium]